MGKDDNDSLRALFLKTVQGKIFSGELKPGDRLPSERELAERVGISRGSVNQGMLDLERMGFVRIVPRKGAFVADFMSSTNPETFAAIMSYDSALIDPALFRDLMAMRTLVERECVRLACLRVGAEETARLNELVNRIYSSDEETVADALFGFHYYLTAASGNKAYALLFRSFENMLRRLIELHYKTAGELRRALPLYNGLIAAISSGQCAEADELICRILDNASAFLNKIL